MTKEEREKQLRGYKWKLLYGLFICFIVWVWISTIEVWHMRLDYAESGYKRELSKGNFYNFILEGDEDIYENK